MFCALLFVWSFLIQIGRLRHLIRVCGEILTVLIPQPVGRHPPVFLPWTSSRSLSEALSQWRLRLGFDGTSKGPTRCAILSETCAWIHLAPFKSPVFIWSPHLCLIPLVGSASPLSREWHCRAFEAGYSSCSSPVTHPYWLSSQFCSVKEVKSPLTSLCVSRVKTYGTAMLISVLLDKISKAGACRTWTAGSGGSQTVFELFIMQGSPSKGSGC